MTTVIIDYDAIVYKAGFACEKRNVLVTHTASGKTREFKNKTEFQGTKKNEIGGWLGEQNKIREAEGKRPFSREEFTLETVRVADSLENALHTVKCMVNDILEKTNADSYIGYIGKGIGFREGRSTIYKYKGNRDDVLRPLLKDDIIEYLVKHHNGILVDDVGDGKLLLEADDWCIIEALRTEDSVIAAVDKDTRGFAVRVFNPDKPEDGIIDCDCFGELEIVEKIDSKTGKVKSRDVKGFGRKFFYFQVGYGDDVDNYRANSATDMDWGPLSTFKFIDPAKNDREALQGLKTIYQTLYPTPKEIIGWRGDTIKIDWKYVLSENWDLARMMRSEDDFVTAEQVFTKFGLWED